MDKVSVDVCVVSAALVMSALKLGRWPQRTLNSAAAHVEKLAIVLATEALARLLVRRTAASDARTCVGERT